MVGWDEILQPDLPKNIVVQSWRGQASLAEAAKEQYRGLLSYGYYLDLMWPAAQHYLIDPLSDDTANLTPTESSRILGGEACMWTEFVSAENIDSRIWPRAAAIAERMWSPASVRDVPSMYARLDRLRFRLEWLGLTHDSAYVPMLRRIAGSDDISALRVLADLVEPVKNYDRAEQEEAATSITPLNRLVDAARPESQTGREFSAMVEAILANKATPEMKEQVRSLLVLWRDNHEKLEGLEAKSFLMKDVMPISQNLAGLAAAGLQALDYLSAGRTAPESWTNDALALADEAKKPQSQVLLTVAPPIARLIRAAAGTGIAGSPK